MNYFIFKPANNTSETGPVYPQVQKMSPGYNYKADNSVHALSRTVNDFPDYTPNLDYFIVKDKAKLTDLLSVAMVRGGFLVSEKLKNVLEQFNLAPHKFYPAKVSHKKQFHNYFWMHIVCDLTNIVDYPNSTFFIYHSYSNNLGNIEICSKTDLLEKRKSLKQANPGKLITIWAEKVTLNNSSFDQKLDFFEIGNFDSNYYISEKLKNIMNKEHMTGIDIQLTEIVNIR